MTKIVSRIILGSLTLSFSAPLWAHVGTMHGQASSLWANFGTGFMHPLLSWDHLLVILAVALNLHALNRRMPLTPSVKAVKQQNTIKMVGVLSFIALFGIGALLGKAIGAFGTLGTLMELLVLTSLPLAVFLLLVSPRASLVLSGLFALLHGAVHGAELGSMSTGTLLGMLTAASLLLIAVGFLCSHCRTLRLCLRSLSLHRFRLHRLR